MVIQNWKKTRYGYQNIKNGNKLTIGLNDETPQTYQVIVYRVGTLVVWLTPTRHLFSIFHKNAKTKANALIIARAYMTKH
jgi:hypothetical protein